MVELTVIDGGGEPPDWENPLARQAFKALLRETLRAIARADDYEARYFDALAKFMEACKPEHVHVSSVIDDVLRKIYEDRSGEGRRGAHDDAYSAAEDGLRVVAELLAEDGFARGRLSQRENIFIRAMETYMVEHERRARRNGWSYLDHISRFIPEPRPVARPKTAKTNGRKKSGTDIEL